jgi:hypothetical protein
MEDVMGLYESIFGSKKKTKAELLLGRMNTHNNLEREKEKNYHKTPEYQRAIENFEKLEDLMPSHVSEKVTEFNVNGVIYTPRDFIDSAYKSAKASKKNEMEKCLGYLEKNLASLSEKEQSQVSELIPRIRGEYQFRISQKNINPQF